MRIGMSRRSAKLFAAMLAIVAICCFAPRHAQGAEGVPYTSLWGDYTTSIPAGWTASYDCEAIHYTDTTLKPPGGSGYVLAIRWYTRSAIHWLLDGNLEMYEDGDDYARQAMDHNYGPRSEMVEEMHDVEVGGLKASRFVVQCEAVLNPSRLGPFVADDVSAHPVKHAYTFVAAPFGFYVLAYFAPQDGYGRYEQHYEQLVAAFTAKGQGGPSAPSAAANAKQLESLLSIIASRRDAGVPSHHERRLDERGNPADMAIAPRLYSQTGEQLRDYAMRLTAKLPSAPPIPEGATRDFVRGVTFMKAAKGVSDYRTAVDAFQSALSSAPWWGDAYYNLGIALESAERYDEATEAIDWYLKTKPSESDVAQAQKKIYEIQAKQELAAKKKAELSSRLNSAESDFNNNGNYGQALEVFREVAKAADEGGAEDRVAVQVYKDLGFVYREGKGVTQDYAEAAKWWRKAAEKGYAPAQCELGLAYYYGLGVNLDYAEAVKWYRKAVEQGNAAAMCCLGVCYRTGNGVPRDRAEAVNWYRKAAKAGSTTAQDNLREMGEK